MYVSARALSEYPPDVTGRPDARAVLARDPKAKVFTVWADVQFPDLNGAQRQRRQIDAGVAMGEVYAQLVAETGATYAEPVRS